MTNIVKINGKEYPIKCNIEIMQEIQDRYETLYNFELKIAGYTPALNKDGSLMRSNGDPVMRVTEPSLKVIYDILPLMLKAAGNEDIELSPDELEFNIDEVGSAMHEAYKDCYTRKNQQSAKDQEEKTAAKK